jgi:6-phosphogluconate dehydrogenase
MELGFVGLGKMGGNMVKRLRRENHTVYAFDRNADVVKSLASDGVKGVAELSDIAKNLSAPRAVWLMVPAGAPVDSCIETILPSLSKGDVIIDGGNSNFKDTISRAEKLKSAGIYLVDAGTSGGVWGLENGYCLMVGGEKEAFKIIEPAIKTLAPTNGYLHVGGPGAGHHTKMIHNGIEYAIMQAYAEGFEIMKESRYSPDLYAIAKLWNQGSVVRSWLLELIERMLSSNSALEGVSSAVADSGEGRWTVQEAIDLSVSSPTITLSLLERFRSRRDNTYSNRFLSALRNQFGGHSMKKE